MKVDKLVSLAKQPLALNIAMARADDILSQIPPNARALAAIGDETGRAVLRLFDNPQASLFPPDDDPLYADLASALRENKWSDKESAQLVDHYREWMGGDAVGLKDLIRWVLAHGKPGIAENVLECMKLRPPEEIEIIRLLSKRGSQKIVFLASWRLRQQEVVLKQILGGRSKIDEVLARELRGHPLSMVHPNIIETHILRNKAGDIFLVEKTLPEVLNDKWVSLGLNVSANLLFDILKALKFLHDNDLVHGDVKPDNIGISQGSYILLDFGICRPISEFAELMEPTGSIRTRAPELLLQEGYTDPPKVDIWALGATLYNTIVRKYPLVDNDEDIPRISDPERRLLYEKKIAKRASDEWERRLDFSNIPVPLRELLSSMLEKDPRARIDAASALERAEEQLRAYLRSTSNLTLAATKFSPLDEVGQIENYMKIPGLIGLLPTSKKQTLEARLDELKTVPGFDDIMRTKIAALVGLLRTNGS